MKTKVQRLIEWGRQHGLEMTAGDFDIEAYESHIESGIPADYLFLNDASSALQELGESFDGEMGTGPEEYLPGVVASCFELVKDHIITEIKVISDDQWDSAEVSCLIDGNAHQFTIPNVDDSDWIPDDLYYSLIGFSKQYLKSQFKVLQSEDFMLLLYLPAESIAELDAILSE